MSLSSGIKGSSTRASDQGNSAHETAYALLRGQPFVNLGDEEMIHIKTYVDFIFSKKEFQENSYFLEKRISLEKHHPDLYGTADAILYDSFQKKLTIVDFKFGFGIVEPEENPQLLYYAAGALEDLNHLVDEIELVIVQPRAYHQKGTIRRWITDSIRMIEFLGELLEDVKKTELPNAELKKGDHCHFCPALAICPLHQSVAKLVTKDPKNIPSDPKMLSEALKMIPQLENWIEAVKSFAVTEAHKGNVPDGFRLMPKRAMRKWQADVDYSVIMREFNIPYEKLLETKMISPAQAEKLLPKSAHKFLSEFISEESSGFNLVPLRDEKS